LTSLSGAPDVFDSLVIGLEADNPVWDFQPDPDRFTLREVIAHIADIEQIFLDRLVRTKQNDGEYFERPDSGQMAIDRNYGSSNPEHNLTTFRSDRQKLIEFLSKLIEEEWTKVSVMDHPMSPWTIQDQVIFLAVHDGYHAGQTAQWLKLWRGR
jgi:uncharacterized damage-inducible protein DinB